MIRLRGPLGAGKSLLARGVAEGLGVTRWRGSPTFALIHEYATEPPLFHADLYRLDSVEVEDLGLEEYAHPDAVLVVEWPERALNELRMLAVGRVLDVDIEITGLQSRLVRLEEVSGDSPIGNATT